MAPLPHRKWGEALTEVRISEDPTGASTTARLCAQCYPFCLCQMATWTWSPFLHHPSVFRLPACCHLPGCPVLRHPLETSSPFGSCSPPPGQAREEIGYHAPSTLPHHSSHYHTLRAFLQQKKKIIMTERGYTHFYILNFGTLTLFCHFYLPRGSPFPLFWRINSSSLRLSLESHSLWVIWDFLFDKDNAHSSRQLKMWGLAQN